MKKLISILVISLMSPILHGQCEKVFDYTDTVFQPNSIHHLPFVFDYNGGQLIKDSITVIELEKLTSFIKAHPEISFQIEHHTHHRGNNKYNEKLSQRRAFALVNDLHYNYQVDTSKVKAVGYGESMPIIPEKYIEQMNLDDNVPSREHIYALNRRTLLRIINISE